MLKRKRPSPESTKGSNAIGLTLPGLVIDGPATFILDHDRLAHSIPGEDQLARGSGAASAFILAASMAQPGRVFDAGCNTMKILPGITRKITACTACRKNKVCRSSYSRWYMTSECILTASRSNVKCQMMARRAYDVVVDPCLVY